MVWGQNSHSEKFVSWQSLDYQFIIKIVYHQTVLIILKSHEIKRHIWHFISVQTLNYSFSFLGSQEVCRRVQLIPTLDTQHAFPTVFRKHKGYWRVVCSKLVRHTELLDKCKFWRAQFSWKVPRCNVPL